MVRVSIQTKIEGIKKNLEDLNIEVPNLAKKILSASARRLKTLEKKAYKTMFKHPENDKWPGKNGFTSTTKNSSASVGSSQQYKMMTLENGKHIVPKKNKYLTFKNGDTWVKVKSVDIAPHPFFFKTGESYLSGSEHDKMLEKMTQKMINKVMSKRS